MASFRRGRQRPGRATQFLQADGLRYAVEADRRRKYHNSGTLPWQFNEPYPMAACTSAVDYFASPKPAYYAVARAYAPLTVTACFPIQAWAGREEFEAGLWASHSGYTKLDPVGLVARLVGASGSGYASLEKQVSVRAKCRVPLEEVRWSLAELHEEVFFLDLRVVQPDGQILADNRYIFSRTENLASFSSVPAAELEAVLESAREARATAGRSG